MDFDFLSLLEESATEASAIPSEVPAETPALQILPDALATSGDGGHVESESRSIALPTFRKRTKFTSMVGRVGLGRHGSFAERSLLAYHMRASIPRVSVGKGCLCRCFRCVLLLLSFIADSHSNIKTAIEPLGPTSQRRIREAFSASRGVFPGDLRTSH